MRKVWCSLVEERRGRLLGRGVRRYRTGSMPMLRIGSVTTGQKNSTAKDKTALPVRERVHTEEFARDSFQNLLFSICRFKQLTLTYPSKITVVSLPFKENRFHTLHREALRLPSSAFSFVGVGDATPEAVEGERKNSVVPFTSDPYGCHGSLKEKREGRNPWNVESPYPKGCPELRGLFEFCGDGIYPGPLPWDRK
mmetsp:Transcript_99561/g.149099  ORF Transcript_99561/g.149099 Transcript_99561/m.149099 type:complete len:196 (-) Transcript_99561:290-877(-)